MAQIHARPRGRLLPLRTSTAIGIASSGTPTPSRHKEKTVPVTDDARIITGPVA
jgi:hypothetical protein